MSIPDISEYFSEVLKNDMSPAIGAMMALMESLRRDDSTTLQEFIGNANHHVLASFLVKTAVEIVSSVSLVTTFCQLFLLSE